jgi:2-polyprenyl-3-methyl-5-hydroxy-6-metoxy-1,4-benzoquinol methylase
MDKSEKFWNKFSKNYDKQAKGDKAYTKIHEIIKKYFNPGHTVLDFACATGLYSIDLAEEAKEIHGFDISSKMIEAANKTVADRGIKNADYVKTTIFDERYKPESYDLIMALNILLYFQDTDKVVKRLYELLKPGGTIITTTACLATKKTFLSYVSGSIIFMLMKIGILPKIRFFNIAELEELIKKESFKIVETDILMLYPATEYMIIAKKNRIHKN